MTLTISASQLSLGSQGDDVARVQQAIQKLGRTVPIAEAGVLGAGTVAVLKALQADFGLPGTGIVDAATVKAINARLATLATDPRVVRGSVLDADGNPFTNGFVEIFSQGPGSEQAIGKGRLNASDGSYEISYQPPANGGGRIDLRVEVRNARGPIETTPSSASILTNAGPLEVVNFVLSGAAHPPHPEFELILADLKPLLGSRDLAELKEDAKSHEVSLLASQSGRSSAQVAALAIATRLANDTKVPAALFYGLLREGLPAGLAALQRTHPDVRRKALKAAVEKGTVPKTIGGKNIETYLSGLAPTPDARLKGLLGQVLNARQTDRFVGEYLKSGQHPDAFWERIAADPALAGHAQQLKLTVQVAGLTNSHDPLVSAVLAHRDIKQASDLVRLTEEQWKSLIRQRGVGVPADTPGANADEKMANYVWQIVARVEAAFPTQFFAERLGTSPVGAFLKAHPSYDLKTTYPALFFNKNPAAAQALKPQERQQLQAFQRVYRLTGNAKETVDLAAKGMDSAQKISRVAREVFAKDIFPNDRANEVYDRALRTSAMALALFGEHAAGLNRTGLQALPKLDIQKQADLAANNPVPDWQTLFGASDFCACRDCASVHGAAAYFVDVLQFLGERGVRAPLFARRPDLGDIELSCENTNTPLPLIDLVNEALENAVVPPPPFAPFNLAPALEADLAQTTATPALTAAFSPPLQSGTRVETVESGRRWRVWDEPFAFSVVKENNAAEVVARSRQTTGSAAERRATPQYRNGAAYAELGRSVYPWNLPFDLPSEEANIFLAHLGVSRHDLIETLRPAPEPFDPNAPVVVRLAAERLGLTDTGRKIIVGEPLTPPQPPEAFWGSVPVAALKTVQELLDRSGLSYAELDALVATRFIDPGNAVTIAAKSGEPVDTCDTTKLRIDGLTADVLGRTHRFVRLRRSLGWTIPELDCAIRALAPAPNTPVLTNEVLVRLDHLRTLSSQLRLSVAQTLALWRPIDTAEPGSLYRSLFYNPAVFKPQDEDFQLRPDGQELAHTDKLLGDAVIAAALQAAFRLNSTSFALLLAKTDGALNLANLSLIYRHAIFARQLRLTVPNLSTAIDLTGIDPFRAERSQDTLRFIEAVKAIRASGFDFPQLDYLLRHRFSSAASFVPAESSLAQTLTEVRAGLLKVDAQSDAEKQKLQRSAVADRVSAALGLPADVTDGLLKKRVTHGGETALQRFVELSAIADKSLSRNNATAQFETLGKLLKIATLIRALELPGSRLDWLFLENSWLAEAPDPPSNPVPFANWFSLIQLQQLRRDLSLEGAALESVLGAISAVAAAEDQPGRLAAKRVFVDSLSKWLGWPQEDLDTLVGKSDDLGDRGLLNARLPDDYRVDLLARLHRTMGLLKRLGAAAVQANQWCDASVSDANAKAIRGAAKAKYDDDAWQKLVVPLQDSLRDKQREALVSYLVARPAQWTTLDQPDANDLYAHFLIDVEMSSCQLTSRIKQAIGSVQLFAQRCLMGLEQGVQTADSKWQQWKSWMKNFRVWEANRKIWLYPENWIEPELRDDKSPFFKDLENELLQSDLDNAAAEQVLMRYLEKLDEVARLEIAGVYEDGDKTLHVFGRSFHTPHIYYYRRQEGTTHAWTPWEKLDLDIEGDHLIPVMWNRKLMLIWPIFTEKKDEKQVVMPGPGQPLKGGKRHWEIQLAWSEFQYGRWTGKNLSEPVRFEATQGDPYILFGKMIPRPGFVMARDTVLGGGDGGGGDGGGGGGGGGDGTSPGSSSETEVPRLVAKNMMTFKALVSGDLLTVRGYLRLDYGSADPDGNSGIAVPFGEFRFFGCRKIVTTAHLSQMANASFALAPKGTRFDGMWFAETGSGLTLLDGTFPLRPRFVPPTVFDDANEPGPLPTDPSSTVARRIDIPVLAGTASTYRLLPPHQDPQFIGDRPFFFMDGQRAFIVSSTGNSGFRPNPADWAVGDLATVAVASETQPDTGGPTNVPLDSRGAFTVLVPGPGGRRIARELTPVNLNPSSSARMGIPSFWTTRAYTFRNFHHAYLCNFVQDLNRTGIDALLSLETQSLHNAQSFDVYDPTPRVAEAYPADEVEFHSGGAYDLYNWELFFHIPLLIATHLRNNQRFEEAQRWFHYIFDPTGFAGGEIPRRYWRTKPFHDRLSGDYEAESVKALEEMAANGPSDDLTVAVDVWRSNPFSPHAVARLRTTAYQKTVVMKYIDNLIAWGDQLFRRETLESINEATQLYVLAAEMLGRRPDVIERNVKLPVQTFNSLAPGLLGNALEQIEHLVSEGPGTTTGDSSQLPDPPPAPVLYFCVPENDKLLGYWGTVADRLFKIRHCMNIEGQVRQLPLFEPPIDPALLVRAQAAGLSISDVLSDISASLPNYRFAVMLQKANEVVSEVRNLGAGLLSTLEKRDAEALSTLRSGQELRLLQAVRDIRVNQIYEAKTNSVALQESRNIADARKQYYEGREFMNAEEKQHLHLLRASNQKQKEAQAVEILGNIYSMYPNATFGTSGMSTAVVTAQFGGTNLALAAQAFARSINSQASDLSFQATRSATMGGHHRRDEEWKYQGDLAARELKQIDKQILAAQIRQAIAEEELKNHDQQVENAQAVDAFMHDKFTNQDLYQWMTGQVSGLYFQSYQLAYDLAKRAELCMQHELGLKDGETSFIRFGYWDSLKKGLLAGDHLAHDLKRLDLAYLDKNVREYELTKHVSLATLDPAAFINLKETGKCEQVKVPEWLFDLDTPGHYLRRLKMVGVTIPCVTGPYTGVHCKLRLEANEIRWDKDPAGDYPRDQTEDDPRFIVDRKSVDAMVTSTAQNDSGLFEPNMRDERYLPFEGAGAVSTWTLELPMDFKSFDYSTISDVILHLRYAARDGGEPLRQKAAEATQAFVAEGQPLARLFSLRHEFPSEWRRFVSAPASAINAMTLDLAATRFPYFVQGRQISINEAKIFARTRSVTPPQMAVAPEQTTPTLSQSTWVGSGPGLAVSTSTGQGYPGPWTFVTDADPKLVEDVFVIFAFGAR